MSSLRRRILGSLETPAATRQSRTPSPAAIGKTGHDTSEVRRTSRPGLNNEDTDETVPVSISKLKRLNEYVSRPKAKTKPSKKWSAWLFILGGFFGILAAGFFVGRSDVIELSHLRELNLDSLFDALPAGLLKDAKDLTKAERDAVNYDSFSVGLHAKSQGVNALHPVIMIPGVISTGLESWGTDDYSRQYFRKRLWGSFNMIKALILDQASWKRHIMLDKQTGLDPPGIKLRAAQGFDATDFFITGYWIWNKILENLATIGYDPSNAFTAAYDWRLAYGNLEVRDQFFTRLKTHIETASRISDQKVVLLSHSMGSQVLYYFFHWVEAEGHGNGGTDWVDTYVDSWINISGCMLGAVKGIPAVLSGEMRDTAQLNTMAVYGLEKFLSRQERAELFRGMPGISSMLPIGGEAVWGDKGWAPDDLPGQNQTFGKFITFRPTDDSKHAKNLTVGEAIPYLFDFTEPWYKDLLLGNYSHGIAFNARQVEENQQIPKKWTNPLETRLPLAPNMKIYCFYGVGKPTERAYYYREDNDPSTKTNVSMDTTYTNGDADHGVIMGEGDGTVNLLSTGYMCSKGWHIKRYNPADIKIRVVEMEHEPDRFSPRGGPNTGDHVDILGRSSLNDLILRVAGGKGELIEENVVSNIRQYSAKVKVPVEDE